MDSVPRQHARVNNREVARLWAEQGRYSARAGNLSFDGDTIRSYAAEIGRHVGSNGDAAVLLATRTWSKTTTKHQRLAAVAAGRAGLKRFHVTNLDGDHEVNRRAYFATVDDLVGKASRARVYRQSYVRDILGTIAEAEAYARHFGLNWEG